MAIVGSAHVVIRALTDKLQSDIQQGLQKAAASAGSSGSSAGKAFSDGFNSNLDIDSGGKVTKKIEKNVANASSRAEASVARGIADGMGDGAQAGARAVTQAAGRAGGAAGNVFGRMFNSSSGGPSRIFISMALRIAALLPLLGALAGGISSVVSGLFAMASAAGNAIYALSPLPGLVGALVQGGAVLMTAFSGIGDAVSAGLEASRVPAQAATKAMDDLKTAARDAAEAVRDAAEAVRDAQEGVRDAAEAIRDAHEAWRDAVKDLADTEEAAAQMIIDAQNAVKEAKERRKELAEEAAEAEEEAAERVADAEEALADSHKNVQKAQEALTEARKEAQERLLDLQFASRGGAIAEQRAIMALQDARYRLNATSELPADNRLRQEAQLAYDEAQLNLEMVKERNGDTAEELGEIREKGVDGTDEVVAAQERLVDAQDDVLEATEAVSDAMEDQRDLVKDIAEAQKAANDAVKEAKDALRDAYKDAPEMIRDAQEAVRDAREAISDSNEALSDAQEALRDALTALADAKNASADANNAFSAGIPEMQKYQEALNNLSPPARRFVEFLISISDEMRTLRDAAQAGLFPGLQTAIENLVFGPLFPALRTAMYETGVAIANAAISISESLSTGPFVQNFGTVAEGNNRTIERMGLVVGDLAAALFAFMAAAQPVTDELTKWLVKWAEGVRVQTEASNASGALTDKLVAGGEQMKQLIRITSNLWEGIRDIGTVAAPAGQSLLDAFEGATERFAKFTDNKKNVKELSDQFDNIADNLRAIGDLALVVGGAFFRLGADPMIGRLAKQLESVVLNLESLITDLLDSVGPQLTHLVDQIIVAFEEISKSGALSVFLDTMSTAIGALITAFQTPVLGDALRLIVKIGAALYAISILSKFPGISFVVKALGFLATRILPQVALAIGRVILAMGPIGWIITAIGLLALGFKIAYERSETFRRIVDTTMAVIRTALSLAWEKFQQFGDIVGSVFGRVVDAATWLWDVLFGNSIFPDIQNAFEAFFDAVGAIFTGIANFFTQTIPNAAQALFGWLTEHWKVILVILTGPVGLAIVAITNNWDKIKAVFVAAKDWVVDKFAAGWRIVKDKIIDPVLEAKDKIGDFFGEGGPVRGFFNGIKNWVVNTFSNAWNAVKSTITGPIDSAKDTIRDWFGEGGPIRGFFSGIGTWVSNTFKNIWDGLQIILTNPVQAAKNIFNNLLGKDGPIRDAFDKAVGAIGTIWEGLQKLLATPVNFMINTVYNDGLRKALNLLPGVDLERATGITIPESSKASGGVLPGWSPGKDIHHFYSPTAGRLNLSGGEAIMRPEFTRAVGGESGVNRLNALARNGLISRFARGGVFRPVATGSMGPIHPTNATDIAIPTGSKVVSIADGTVARSYDIAGPLPTDRYDGDGPYGSYGRVIMINHPGGFASLYAHLSQRFAQAGQAVTGGTVIGLSGNTGNSSGPHIHFGVTGTKGPYDFNFGSKSYGDKAGPATNPGQEEKDSWLEIIKEMPGRLKGVYDDIQVMGGKGGYFPMLRNSALEVGSDVVQWINDKIPDKIVVPNFPDLNLPNNPIPDPFDRGGIAQGESNVWMPKRTARPERVLDPAQTQAFERLVTYLERNGVGGQAGGGDINLEVHVPQDASARDVVEGIVYEMRRFNRGGRYNG